MMCMPISAHQAGLSEFKLAQFIKLRGNSAGSVDLHDSVGLLGTIDQLGANDSLSAIDPLVGTDSLALSLLPRCPICTMFCVTKAPSGGNRAPGAEGSPGAVRGKGEARAE